MFGGAGESPGGCQFLLKLKSLPFAYFTSHFIRASQVAWLSRIHLPMQEMQEMQFQSLGWADPLEEEIATHASILAWEIPWTEEPDGLQSMGLKRVGHD